LLPLETLPLYPFTPGVQGEALVGVFEAMAPVTDNSKRTGAAIEAHYQFLAWLGSDGGRCVAKESKSRSSQWGKSEDAVHACPARRSRRDGPQKSASVYPQCALAKRTRLISN
jgi:hypothetical protein